MNLYIKIKKKILIINFKDKKFKKYSYKYFMKIKHLKIYIKIFSLIYIKSIYLLFLYTKVNIQ